MVFCRPLQVFKITLWHLCALALVLYGVKSEIRRKNVRLAGEPPFKR